MLIRMPNWFQPSGTPYRPGTFSSTGLTVANPGNGYDTSAGVVDTSTSSTASTTGANTTGTQTYSAAPSHAAVTGVLNVRIKIDINAFNGTVQGPNGTASVFYSTDGSTPSWPSTRPPPGTPRPAPSMCCSPRHSPWTPPRSRSWSARTAPKAAMSYSGPIS